MNERAAAIERSGRDGSPWYRHGWVWFVIAIPLAAVLGGIVTVFLAVRSSDGVVAADYYKRGLAINEELSRHDRARALGLTLELMADGIDSGDRVRLTVSAAQPLPAEATVNVRLVHPGRAGADRTARLARTIAGGDGRGADFVGAWSETTPAPANVAWRLIVETQHWRVEGDARDLAAAPARSVRLVAR